MRTFELQQDRPRKRSSFPPVRSLEKPTHAGRRLAAGNRAVQRWLEAKTSGREAVRGEPEPDQRRIEPPVREEAFEVTAVFRGGSRRPETRLGGFTPQPGAIVASQRVAPSGSPTVHAGGGNDCTPGTETLAWSVVDGGANWRADVTAMQVSGDIHITAWPSSPTSMTVPNTANPVDGGNINNTTGSSNHWRAVIDDMADYDTAGSGGAGANWHSTAASTAHEWAHWNQDYLADAIPTGDWVRTNSDIDAITVPKAGNADAAAARTALRPLVDARFNTFLTAVTRRWNVLIGTNDNPGAGGRGYAAGMGVLNGLIARVRAYASSKGWTGASTGSGAAPPTPPATP